MHSLSLSCTHYFNHPIPLFPFICGTYLYRKGIVGAVIASFGIENNAVAPFRADNKSFNCILELIAAFRDVVILCILMTGARASATRKRQNAWERKIISWYLMSQ